MLVALALTAMGGESPMSDKLATPRAFPPWEPLERVGEGATSVVWRARHAEGGRLVALKVARADDASTHAVAREATLMARVARRWGPALVDAGAGFLATEWIAGSPVDPRALGAKADRELLAAVVAHGVGRALEELHEAGVRHGDVKPQNVLCAPRAHPTRDAAEDRGATLIDLGLAAEVASEALGGTPRYAAPELRERGEAGPAADVWALGLVLAEILDSARGAGRRSRRRGRLLDRAPGEPARWVQALLVAGARGAGRAPRGSRRAPRGGCGLRADDGEAASRARGSGAAGLPRGPRAGRHAPVAQVVARDRRAGRAGGSRRRCGWARKLDAGRSAGAASRSSRWRPSRRARWLVSLVGPERRRVAHSAATSAGKGALVARAAALARERDPAAVDARGPARRRRRRAPRVGPGGRRGPRRAPRARARPSRRRTRRRSSWPRTSSRRGRAPAALAVPLAAALARAGETGRAWAALGGDRGTRGRRAPRRAGAPARADREARRARRVASSRPATRPAAAQRAGDARAPAWDAGDLDERRAAARGARAARRPPRCARSSRGAAARTSRRSAASTPALAEPLDGRRASRGSRRRGVCSSSRAGRSGAALRSFGRAVELATRAGAVSRRRPT